MALLDLDFSDLFVGPDHGWSWYRATPSSHECLPIPGEYHRELSELRDHLTALGEYDDARTEWCGIQFRVTRKSVDDSVVMYALRRPMRRDYSMKGIGLPPALIAEIDSAGPFLSSGAIAVFGPPDSGKTTTAISIVLDRLRLVGGTAWRIGCPVDIKLQGQHGKGWLYDLNVANDIEIGKQLRDMYRLVPSIVVVEEVRDAATAREILRAAGSGYLIVFTMHANDLQSGVGQFIQWASGEDVTHTAALVADFLRLALFVELHAVPVGAKVKQSTMVEETPGRATAMSAKPLFITDGDSSRSIVRSGDLHRLNDVVTRQRRMLMSGDRVLASGDKLAE